jgi:protein SCO1
MLSKNRIKIAALFFSALILFLIFAVGAGGQASSHFPNVELITQDGKTVHFYDDLIKGKIVAIDLIYTTCHYSCPLETARLVQVQKKLGDRVGNDIFFYSISIDPDHDTPQVLKEYMEKFHVGPGWTFLTGKKADIDFLSKRLGLYSDPSVNADGHIAHLLIGNEATGQWMRGSALDNPSFQAHMIGDFLDNFKHDKSPQTANLADSGPIRNFDKGKYLFGKNCLACHTIGHGDLIGPDLLGITRIRSHQWLARMIQRPDLMLSEKDPIATALFKKYNSVPMPNIYLGDQDTAFIISYMETQSAARDKEAASGQPAKSSSAGNAPSPPNR